MKHIMIIVVMSIIMTDTFAAIKIDGELSEPEWKNAQKFTFQAGDPSFEVTALVLWDETYFYFGCTMPDPTVEGKHESGIQPVWEDNGIEFYLETDNAKFEGRSTNSFQLLFSAAGAYNDTSGNGQGGNGDYDFTWDSRIEYVVALEPGTTLNDDSDQDKGWRVEARLPWSDMSVDGKTVRGKTMGWNVIYVNRDGGASTAFSWSPDVNGFANNHIASNWGEITFVEGYVPAVSGNPADLGQTVNGFQDDFIGATRDPNWVAVGPSGDKYVQTNGVLQVAVAHGDPNHLLYMAPGGSNIVQEVLARMRVVGFGTLDYVRGGVCVGALTNVTGAPATNWAAFNLHFRDVVEDNAPARHFRLLDDNRAWGPHLDQGWTNNVWYWLRLNIGGSTNPVLGKVWLADGQTPEPANWQMTWTGRPVHPGYVGITGCSGESTVDRLAQTEIDYVLIKSPSLPSITVNFAAQGPPSNPPLIHSARKQGKNFVIDWFGGVLQTAADLNNSWTNSISGPSTARSATASPATNALSAAPLQFYQVRQ